MAEALHEVPVAVRCFGRPEPSRSGDLLLRSATVASPLGTPRKAESPHESFLHRSFQHDLVSAGLGFWLGRGELQEAPAGRLCPGGVVIRRRGFELGPLRHVRQRLCEKRAPNLPPVRPSTRPPT